MLLYSRAPLRPYGTVHFSLGIGFFPNRDFCSEQAAVFIFLILKIAMGLKQGSVPLIVSRFWKSRAS